MWGAGVEALASYLPYAEARHLDHWAAQTSESSGQGGRTGTLLLSATLSAACWFGRGSGNRRPEPVRQKLPDGAIYQYSDVLDAMKSFWWEGSNKANDPIAA
jgi:hypothetical protein